MSSPSYSGLATKELWALHRVWQKGKALVVRCEDGHDECGCSVEVTQDGKAPCHREVERELIWRNAATETVGA